MKKLLSPILALWLLGTVGSRSQMDAQTIHRGRARAVPGAGARPIAGPAEADKPLVTLSFAGYNALQGQIDAVGKVAGNPGLASALEAFLPLLTQGKQLAGLDKTRPWGAVILASGRETNFDQFFASSYVFVPVTDLKQLAALVPDAATGKPLAPGADGVYEIKSHQGKPVYLVQKGAWAILAGNREMLTKVPADPAPLLGDLPGRYTLACRVSMKNLPQPIRQVMNGQVQQLSQMLMQGGGDDEEDDLAVGRTAAFQWSLQKALGLINDLEEVLCGMAVDPTGKSVHFDCRLSAIPGSQTAATFARMKGASTALAEFTMPDAAVTFNWAAAMDDFELAQTNHWLANFRSQANRRLDDSEDLTADQAEVAKRLLSDGLGVVQRTLRGRKIDCGLSLQLKPHASTLLAGAVIADGEQLDKVVKQVVAQIRADDPDSAKSVKLDAEIHEGVHFHVASSTITTAGLAPLLGNQIEVVLGIGPDRLYAGVGRDAAKQLKQAITRSKAAAGKEAPPLRVSAAGAPIARFAAEVMENNNKTVATKITGVLEKTPDRATLTITPAVRGIQVRLEIEEGLLHAGSGLLMPAPGALLPGAVPLPGRGTAAKPAAKKAADKDDPFDSD